MLHIQLYISFTQPGRDSEFPQPSQAGSSLQAQWELLLAVSFHEAKPMGPVPRGGCEPKEFSLLEAFLFISSAQSIFSLSVPGTSLVLVILSY
jgi:hypothetical protein